MEDDLRTHQSSIVIFYGKVVNYQRVNHHKSSCHHGFRDGPINLVGSSHVWLRVTNIFYQIDPWNGTIWLFNIAMENHHFKER